MKHLSIIILGLLLTQLVVTGCVPHEGDTPSVPDLSLTNIGINTTMDEVVFTGEVFAEGDGILSYGFFWAKEANQNDFYSETGTFQLLRDFIQLTDPISNGGQFSWNVPLETLSPNTNYLVSAYAYDIHGSFYTAIANSGSPLTFTTPPSDSQLNFSPDSSECYSVCTIEFTIDEAIADAENYHWNFCEGCPSTISPSLTASYEYELAGFYEVTVVAVTMNGDTLEVSDPQQVEIKSSRFQASPPLGVKEGIQVIMTPAQEYLVLTTQGADEVAILRYSNTGDIILWGTNPSVNFDLSPNTGVTPKGMVQLGSTLLVAGHAERNNQQDLFITSIDLSTGTVGDTRYYGDSGLNEELFSFRKVDDNYILLGATAKTASSVTGIYLVKITTDFGTVEYRETIPITDLWQGEDLVFSPFDSTYMILATTLSSESSADIILLKTDAGGDLLPNFPKTLKGSTSYDQGFSIEQGVSQTEFLIAGTSFSADPAGGFFLATVDISGNSSEISVSGGTTGLDQLLEAKAFPDGSILLAGQRDNSCYLTRIQPNGSSNVWDIGSALGNDNTDILSACIIHPDGGGIAVGKLDNQLLMIKTDISGNYQ